MTVAPPACNRISCGFCLPRETRRFTKRFNWPGRLMPKPYSVFSRLACVYTRLRYLIPAQNRIRAWVDATHEEMAAIRFGKKDRPEWPDWDGARDWQWHGTMTSVVACGNGFLSRGLYSSLAPDAEIVLVQVRDTSGEISSDSIARALHWVRRNSKEFAIRVVSLSVSGDPVWPLSGNAVDEAVATLVEDGINVIAAAGNDGERKLLPPATAPFACTVG